MNPKDSNIEDIKDFRNMYFERQLAAFGKVTLEKLHKMCVMVINLRAVGVEIAKNVTMNSPKRLTVIDDSKLSEEDKEVNWWYSDSQKGQKRSQVLAEKLSELNEFVEKVDSLPFSQVKEEVLKSYDMLIVTDFFDRHNLEELNLICRRNRIGFIYVSCVGVFSSVFVDFYNLKIYERVHLARLKQFYIESISNQNPGIVKISQKEPHFFITGDYVTIQEVEGMVEVNGLEARPIKVIDKFSFSIENTTKYTKYAGGGYVTFEKVPFTKRMNSLKSNFENPKVLPIGDSKFTQFEMHAAFDVYLDWRAELEMNPTILEDKTEEEIEMIALELITSNEEVSNLFEQLDIQINKVKTCLIMMIRFHSFQFLPAAQCAANFASFQQVVITGKFMPVDQCFYLNFDELPEDLVQKIFNKEILSVKEYNLGAAKQLPLPDLK